MSKHKHADLILQYALDAQISDDPSKFWEERPALDCYGKPIPEANSREWRECPSIFPSFSRFYEYRRKADAPPLPIFAFSTEYE
jgi:hypothetical protein